ncbi:hypothetical protein DESC_780152 [Desulfosarcina cetonica]|nr:hypothetical protein DESC_780152 [Desulfosarcina cetonica]
MEPARSEQFPANVQHQGHQARGDHQHAQPHHDPESPEHHGHRWAVGPRPVFQPPDLTIEAVGENKAGEFGNLDFEPVAFGELIRPGEQAQSGTALGVPDALHGGDLYRLMFKGVQAVHVAEKQLQGGHEDGHDHGHAQHDARVPLMQAAPQVVPADAAHHERRGQVGAGHHMDEPVGKGRIEDHRQPVGGKKRPVGSLAETGRSLHPTVGRENPEGRNQRSHRHDEGCRKMHAFAHAVPAEKHDAQKRGFEEKGRQHLVAQKRPYQIARLVGEDGPVGAKLIGKHHPGDHAHAEGDGEDFDPHAVNLLVQGIPGLEPTPLHDGQPTDQADGERGKRNMIGNGKGKLGAGQEYGIKVGRHKRSSMI